MSSNESMYDAIKKNMDKYLQPSSSASRDVNPYASEDYPWRPNPTPPRPASAPSPAVSPASYPPSVLENYPVTRHGVYTAFEDGPDVLHQGNNFGMGFQNMGPEQGMNNNSFVTGPWSNLSQHQKMMDEVRMKEFLKNKNDKEFEYQQLKWKLEAQKREIEQRQASNDRRMQDLHVNMINNPPTTSANNFPNNLMK